MKEVTASGQTIAEAVQSALEQLNTSVDHVNVEIIDEGKKGWFGVFGSKRSIVRVSMVEDYIKMAENYLREITARMNIPVDIRSSVTGKHVTFDLSGDNLALLIGKRGQTLNAMQFLVSQVMANKAGLYYNVTVDAQGYRARRRETLKHLAEKTAAQVKHDNSEITLEAMPSFERKIIHKALQSDTQITTTSKGTEPHRYIIISPAV